LPIHFHLDIIVIAFHHDNFASVFIYNVLITFQTIFLSLFFSLHFVCHLNFTTCVCLFTGAQFWWKRTEEWSAPVGETQAANKQALGAGPMGEREERRAGGQSRTSTRRWVEVTNTNRLDGCSEEEG
jgi:hypothetical protein